MMFQIKWTEVADKQYKKLRENAEESFRSRPKKGKTKTSKAEGLFKQIHKTIKLLAQNPRNPGLQTHEYRSLEHPYNPEEKVFEAYAQHRTPGAFRIFWCYGPEKGRLTIIAITPHP
jgi:mRNA-degrading endonuclease RelE of RelBE toxin-antitoxin system